MSQIFAQRNPRISAAEYVDGIVLKSQPGMKTYQTTGDPLGKTLKLRLDFLPSILILQ